MDAPDSIPSSPAQGQPFATDPCNIFVKFLPPDIDDAKLLSMFEPHGKVESCRVMVDPRSKQSLGYGFVRYETAEQAQIAIERLNRTQIGNKTLLCKLSIPPQHTQPEPSDNLYVKNLPPDMMEADLEKLFAPYGNVEEVRVMIDPQTGQSRQIGFVRFSTKEQAAQAIEGINGRPLPGAPAAVQVKYADTERQKLDRRTRLNYFPQALPMSPPHTPAYFHESQVHQSRFESDRLNAQLQQFSLQPNSHQRVNPSAPARNGERIGRNYSISPTNQGDKRRTPTSPKSPLNPFIQTQPHPFPSHPQRYEKDANANPADREHFRSSKPNNPSQRFNQNHPHKSDASFPHSQPRQRESGQQRNYSQGHYYPPNRPLHPEYPPGYNVPYVVPVAPPYVGIPPVSPDIAMSVAHSPSFHPASPHSPPMGFYAPVPFSLSGSQPPFPYPPPLGLNGPFERHPVDNTNLFIFHLPPDITEQKLAELFMPFGQIDSVKVVKDHVTGDSRGYGFVRYFRTEDAHRAIQDMNGLQIGRKILKVSFNKSNQH